MDRPRRWRRTMPAGRWNGWNACPHASGTRGADFFLVSCFLFVEWAVLRLDEAQGVLLAGGERIVLVPKAAALLRVLAERGGRVVTKDELMTAVWPDVTVEESNLAKL